jgi:hypothetical protein
LHYESQDGRIWTSAVGLGRLEDDTKVIWRKPIGAELALSGQRLDGAAPPLTVFLPGGFAGESYQPSGLTFPTAGCWEVEARADTSVLRIVVHVGPSTIRPVPTLLPLPAPTPTQTIVAMGVR